MVTKWEPPIPLPKQHVEKILVDILQRKMRQHGEKSNFPPATRPHPHTGEQKHMQFSDKFIIFILKLQVVIYPSIKTGTNDIDGIMIPKYQWS